MEEVTPQAIEAAKQELAMLQAEIETLKARQSIAACIRETFDQAKPVQVIKRKARRKGIGSKEPPQVEVTILETDYEQLTRQAQSAAWVEKKLSELKHLGDRLWYQMNQSAILQEAIRRAKEAEMCCRAMQRELEQLKAPPVQTYEQDSGAEREIDYPRFDDFDDRVV